MQHHCFGGWKSPLGFGCFSTSTQLLSMALTAPLELFPALATVSLAATEGVLDDYHMLSVGIQSMSNSDILIAYAGHRAVLDSLMTPKISVEHILRAFLPFESGPVAIGPHFAHFAFSLARRLAKEFEKRKQVLPIEVYDLLLRTLPVWLTSPSIPYNDAVDTVQLARSLVRIEHKHQERTQLVSEMLRPLCPRSCGKKLCYTLHCMQLYCYSSSFAVSFILFTNFK